MSGPFAAKCNGLFCAYRRFGRRRLGDFARIWRFVLIRLEHVLYGLPKGHFERFVGVDGAQAVAPQEMG